MVLLIPTSPNGGIVAIIEKFVVKVLVHLALSSTESGPRPTISNSSMNACMCFATMTAR